MRLLILLAMLWLAPTSHAIDIDTKELPELYYKSVVDILIVDLQKILQTDLPDAYPKISMASTVDIHKIYCFADQPCNVAAITNRQTGDILVVDSFIPNNLFAVSILFHELVHWIQVKKGWFAAMSDCQRWAAQEMQAYQAQNSWLRHHGHAGFSVPDLSLQCHDQH